MADYTSPFGGLTVGAFYRDVKGVAMHTFAMGTLRGEGQNMFRPGNSSVEQLFFCNA